MISADIRREEDHRKYVSLGRESDAESEKDGVYGLTVAPHYILDGFSLNIIGPKITTKYNLLVLLAIRVIENMLLNMLLCASFMCSRCYSNHITIDMSSSTAAAQDFLAITSNIYRHLRVKLLIPCLATPLCNQTCSLEKKFCCNFDVSFKNMSG